MLTRRSAVRRWGGFWRRFFSLEKSAASQIRAKKFISALTSERARPEPRIFPHPSQPELCDCCSILNSAFFFFSRARSGGVTYPCQVDRERRTGVFRLKWVVRFVWASGEGEDTKFYRWNCVTVFSEHGLRVFLGNRLWLSSVRSLLYTGTICCFEKYFV